MHRFKAGLLGAVVALGMFLPVLSQAADLYPNQPITLVVPFAPGGGNDAFARQIAQKLSVLLPQPVVVENRPGAGGNIGSQYVAASRADGYTLLLGHTGTMSINPILYARLGYDPRSELTPVASIASTPLVLVVNRDASFKTLADLIKTGVSKSGPLDYASSGAGTGNHLAAVLMSQKANMHTTHIPYRGTQPALDGLMRWQVDFMFSVIPSVLDALSTGKLRALAMTGEKRSALLPEVPTMAQAGLPDTVSVLHYGILAPKDTSTDIVSYLHRQIGLVLNDPEVVAHFNQGGAEVLVSSNEDYKKILNADYKKWVDVLKKADITL